MKIDEANIADLTNIQHDHLSVAKGGILSTYAPLDAGSKVPTVNLGGSGANNTKYLRGDQTWAIPAGGSGSPGGSDTQVQFNDAGVFGGSDKFVFNKTTGQLDLVLLYGGGPYAISLYPAPYGGAPYAVLTGFIDSVAGPYLNFLKARASSPYFPQSGDALGTISFSGFGGGGYNTSSQIISQASATFSSTSTPSDIIFKTVPSGSLNPVERMRITNDGYVNVAGLTASKPVFTDANKNLVSGESGGGTSHNLLSATHLDTLADSVVAGDLLIGNSTPKWARLPKSTDGLYLKLVGGYPAWTAGGGSIGGSGVAFQPAYFTDATTLSSETGTIIVVCTGTNDHTAIQTALDALPASGKIVKLIGPVAGIGAMLTMGNGNGTGPSTRNGIILQGVGIGATNYFMGSYGGATVLKWTGASGGTLLKVNGAVDGCGIKDLVLDGNNLASILIDDNYGFHLKVDNVIGYRWQGDYAVKIHHTGSWGAGEDGGIWTHVKMLDPYGSSANGIDIASDGGSVWGLTFIGCQFRRSSNDTSIGLRLGNTGGNTFITLVLDRADGAWTGKGIQVKPVSGYSVYPQDNQFISSFISGGVDYDSTVPWTGVTYPALNFYPYYTADSGYTPPANYNNTATLPLQMVRGFTDQGLEIGFGLRDEATVTAASSIAISRPIIFLSLTSGTITVDTINLSSTITPLLQSTFELTIIPTISGGASITLGTGGNIFSSKSLVNYRPVKLFKSTSEAKWLVGD
jgi:hypothetical protein